MKYIKPSRRQSILTPGLSALLALSMIGCDGGMIGTGAGPTTTDPIYELEYLPNRISPDIPETLQNSEEPPPSVNSKDSDFSLRNQDDERQKSGGWRELATELTQVAVARFEIELNTAIIDLAFDRILDECGEQLIDCIIPADQIRVTVTQDVVNRWLDQHVANDGAPYDHVVRASLSNSVDKTVGEFPLFRGEEIITARWHEDGHVAKFTFEETANSTREYFYQNNIPGELVVLNYTSAFDDGAADATDGGFFASILGNDSNQAGVLVQAGSVGSSYDDSVLIGSFYQVFEGRLDDNGGYSAIEALSYDLTDNQNLTSRYRNRQSYDSDGYLLAGEQCNFEVSGEFGAVCNDNVFESFGPEGSQVTDSIHYFTPEEFDSLAAIQDAIRWKVTDVPSDIKSIAVVSAESDTLLSEREALCLGLQSAADDTHIFCTATDEQLDNTVVVEHFNGTPVRIIPSAKLVQIQ